MTDPQDQHDDARAEGGEERASRDAVPDFDIEDLFADLPARNRPAPRDRTAGATDPEPEDDAAGAARPRRTVPRSDAMVWLQERTQSVVLVVAAVSAVLAALSPAEPVGSTVADAVWNGLLGAAVVLLASRARRWALVWLGGVAAVVGIDGGAVALVFALASLGLAASVALSNRRGRIVAALLGAVAVQALLRGPSYGFVGLPTLVGLAAILPVAVTGPKLARSRERRLATWLAVAGVVVVGLAALGAGAAAVTARDQLEGGRRDAEQGLDLVRQGDTDQATAAFAEAELRFDNAADALDGPLTWLGRVTPVVGQHVDAARSLAHAGQDLSGSAAATTSTADYRDLTAEGGRVDLQKVVALQEPVADASASIDGALESVDEASSVWLIPYVGDELDAFRTQVSDIGDQTRLAAEGLAVAPALLGADGPQRYFVSFATPGESRNAGGFAGAYGVLLTDQGDLELEFTGPSSELNPGLADPYQLVYPPDWEQRYLRYHVDLFSGNVTASPDWPTDAEVIRQIYRDHSGTDVAGAVYADPAALAALLQLTGPVRVEGIDGPVTAQNVEQYLLVDQYVEFEGENDVRKDLLGDVAEAVFDALTANPLPGISKIADTLGPAVEAGHLRVTAFDPDAEAFLDDVGISGRLTFRPGADHAGLYSANQLPNKIDHWLHRTWAVDVVHDAQTGDMRSTVTVTLRNDAPGDGFPDYLIGNGRRAPRGTNLDLLGLYSPLSLTSVSLDGEPAGAETQTEQGSNVYSVSVRLEPGQERTVTFELAGTVDPGPYRLDLLPQPLANPDQVVVTLNGELQLFSGELTAPTEVDYGAGAGQAVAASGR